MYLTAQRVLRTKDEKTEVGINAFLYQHSEYNLPPNVQFNTEGTIDWIINKSSGKLIAESVDLVPIGNQVRSFVDIVGRETIGKECIQNFLDEVERDVKERHAPVAKITSERDIAVRFGFVYGLQENEVREYKVLTERALNLFESRNPPKWRSENPWMEIICTISDEKSVFNLSPRTSEKLKQLHGKIWVSSRRISVDHQTKGRVEPVYGDLIQHIAPVLTDLTLEQIAAQGGLILCDRSRQKKIKWPELKELPQKAGRR